VNSHISLNYQYKPASQCDCFAVPLIYSSLCRTVQS